MCIQYIYNYVYIYKYTINYVYIYIEDGWLANRNSQLMNCDNPH